MDVLLLLQAGSDALLVETGCVSDRCSSSPPLRYCKDPMPHVLSVKAQFVYSVCSIDKTG